ncbi:hypothetical protein Ga0074812_15124 [Parafrankia irregularis]|uniref:SnoaL-like domain-containing protein n=1 Tax=Parafrankia irregularis TaxID=795642 RepID=A0A0S4QZS3_9ACTN|nr:MULTISPECIES: hypothetical protein [Parafrankia]MBE3203519.1 hypothetical protein [Parafrankia sp. CH37]CUU60963.1 hypothetical protein Ga0074812_15124 [Parafrankia irregularis]
MNLEEKIALHRRMADGYRDAYLQQGVKDGATYDGWKFATDAIYSSPYFTGDDVINLGEISGGSDASLILTAMADSAIREAKAYSVTFPDWKLVDYATWAAENGYVARVRWEGHTRAGVKMGFYSTTFIETNDAGEIRHWQTFVNDEEYGPFLEVAIGKRGPFKGHLEYMELVDRLLKDNGLA